MKPITKALCFGLLTEVDVMLFAVLTGKQLKNEYYHHRRDTDSDRRFLNLRISRDGSNAEARGTASSIHTHQRGRRGNSEDGDGL
jgi:hypothetical protein